MAVDRRTPVVGGGSLSGTAYAAAVDEEVAALWNLVTVVLGTIAGGTGGNTITAQATPTLGAYAAGQSYWLQPAFTNTGAATLNIDSRGAKPILTLNGEALVGGEIRSGRRTLLFYDGTSFYIMSGSGNYLDIAPFKPGKPLVTVTWARFTATRPFTFPPLMASSRATAGVASSGTAVFSLRKNGVQFGTCTFTSSAIGVFAAAARTDFGAGDVLTIIPPNPQDSSLSDVSMSLAGFR